MGHVGLVSGTSGRNTTSPGNQSCSTFPQVCTGVYNPRSPFPSDQSSAVREAVFRGHQDLVLEPHLVEPSHVVEDVEAAVDLVLQLESSVTSDT